MTTISELQRIKQEREMAVDFIQQEWNERFQSDLFSRSTVRMWLKRYRVTVEQLLEAIDSTEVKLRLCPEMAFDDRGLRGDGGWLYFCAAVWNMINPKRARARKDQYWTAKTPDDYLRPMRKIDCTELLKSVEDRESRQK